MMVVNMAVWGGVGGDPPIHFFFVGFRKGICELCFHCCWYVVFFCFFGGGEREHAKKGVLAKKWIITKIICFHSKTVLLVLTLCGLKYFFSCVKSRVIKFWLFNYSYKKFYIFIFFTKETFAAEGLDSSS